MLPSIEYIKTFTNGLKQWVENRVKAVRKEINELPRPDWTQNDPTAKDYIKNRICYEEVAETVILPETEVTTECDDSEEPAVYIGYFNLTGDQSKIIMGLFESGGDTTFVVHFNGVPYRCKWLSNPETGDPMPALGNLYVVDNTLQDTGEPFYFYIYIYGSEAPSILTTATAGPHKLSLGYLHDEVHKIDAKFLTQGDWSENDKSSPSYVRGRLAYLKDRPTLGTLMFTASSPTKLTRSMISEDMDVLRNIYKLVGKGDALEIDVLLDEGEKYTFVGRVYFDRGNIDIHGEGFQDSNDKFSGHCYYNAGQDFTITLENYTLTVGNPYRVEFLDFRNSVVKMSYRFIPDNFFRQGNAPCNFGSGVGSVMHYGAREASGTGCHAEGLDTTASGSYSHAEGCYSKATDYYAHAEGDETTCNGRASHTEGYQTIANAGYQHVSGCYNVPDANIRNNQGTYVTIVGNGTGQTTRSNAHTLDWDGNAWYSGDVYVGSTGGTNRDDGSKRLATEDYVDAKISDKEMILTSSTPGSTKKFRITVDDSGTISATEVTT